MRYLPFLLIAFLLCNCGGPDGPSLPAVNMDAMSPPSAFRFVDTDTVDSAVTFYEKAANGSRLAYVLDFSSSMDGERITKLYVELNKSLLQIPRAPQKWVSVVTFNSAATSLDVPGAEAAPGASAGWYLVNAGSREAIMSAVKGLATTSGTEWKPAITLALQRSPKPDVIFFMTDADSADSSLAGVVDELTALNNADGHPATIISVCTANNPNADVKLQLDRLTTLNPGGASAVATPTATH